MALLFARKIAQRHAVRPSFLNNSITLRHRHALSAEDACSGKEIRECGAWTLLAALEKRKEADNVQVAQLVSSLAYLLPQTNNNDDAKSEQHTLPHPFHSSDPAFFSIPDAPFNHEWTKQDVLALLQASLKGRRIDLGTVQALLQAATNHFSTVPSVVTLPPLQPNQQLTVVGDLHGSLTDLNTILGLIGDPSHTNRVIFNGDLADRGDHGVEVIAIVCALTLAFPEYVHINRGNHEDLALSVAYGLATEVQHKYGTSVFRQYLTEPLDAFFRSLPLATVVEQDALIVHAGPPPPGTHLESVANDTKPLASRTSGNSTSSEEALLLEACLWSDPEVDEQDGTLVNCTNHLKPNRSRGAGFKFDATIVKQVLEDEGLKRLIRSHEPVHKGCARYTVCSDMELFTVFSASRYPYKQGFNYGAILQLLPEGKHRIARYATEEDEPLMDSSEEKKIILDAVDSITIRRALKRAITMHRAELEQAFEEAGEDVPFEESVRILIRALHLEGEGLSQPGPMRALALALTEQDGLPESLDILGVLDAWEGQEEDEEDTTPIQPIASGWLKAVFAMVDSKHDNEIDREEWFEAISNINASLPEGAQKIDAEFTWNLMDINGVGHIGAKEWSTLATITGR